METEQNLDALSLKNMDNQAEAGDMEKGELLAQMEIPLPHRDLFWLAETRLFRDDVLGKFNVAMNEIGHSLGHTIISFMGGIKDRVIHTVVSLYGGMITEEKFRISNEGTGNDLTKVEYFAKILSWFFGGDVSDYKNYSRSLAYACVPSAEELQRQAVDLFVKK